MFFISFFFPIVQCDYTDNSISQVNIDEINVKLPQRYNFLEEFPECDFGPLTQECGCCYAYSALKMLSHRYCRATHKKLLLSAQFMVTCDLSNAKCDGGNERSSLYFLEKYGAPSDECFPFVGYTDYSPELCSKCLDNSRMKLYKIKPWTTIHYSSVDSIKKAIFLNGPLTTCVGADYKFRRYKGGIYQSKPGIIDGCNHSLELIGWGYENNQEFWYLLNQYGKNWGENGTIRILMHHDEALVESFVYGSQPDLSVL